MVLYEFWRRMLTTLYILMNIWTLAKFRLYVAVDTTD